jgi:hypothetical protein
MERIIMIQLSTALKTAEAFAKIKMRSYCEFKKYYVFRGAKPDQQLYGAIYTTVDRQTGEAGYMEDTALPLIRWRPIEE